MDRFLICLLLISVVSFTGCGNRSEYEAAMHRLVAEQKELDRIDEQIKEIEDDLEAKTDQLGASMAKLTNATYLDKSQRNESINKLIVAIDVLREDFIKQIDPLNRQHDAQTLRVLTARKAADKARKAADEAK